MTDFDLAGSLRRIRRLADTSQRELADRLQLPKSTIAAAECERGGLEVRMFARAAAVAGLRLVLLDDAGAEVNPMAADAVRDLGGRRFPPHLDTRRSDERGWLYEPRRDRPQTSFTFGRDRAGRDDGRRVRGTPEDHHEAIPGDSPAARRAARRREYRQRRAEERERQFLAGELRSVGPDFTCTCPPSCESLDDFSGRPVHADQCPCSCDVG